METDCVFCKIISGQLPAFKIYEDDNFLGFLDINPLSKGNSLLIPKQHYRWVYDVPEFGQYWEIAQKISLASIDSLKAESVSFLTLGYEVPHAHIRIIPRYPNDSHKNGINIHHRENLSDSEMDEIASAIKLSLKK